MQNLLLIPIALSILAGQKPEYNIKGRFTDFKNDTMIVQSCKVADILRASINPDLYIHKDTVVVRNGQLDLQWTVEQPTYFSITPRQAFLQIPGGQRWFQTISDINFFLSKGESIDFKAAAADSITTTYSLTGSLLNKNWSLLRARKLPLEVKSVQHMIANDNASSQEMDSIVKILASIQKESLGIQTQYVRDNPNDLLSGYLITKMPLDTAAVYLKKLSPEVRTSIFAPIIDHVTTRIEVRETRQRAKEQIKFGAEAPNFTLKTIDDKDFTLSSLRGKYVVLDFWGSWCGWCIKGIPEMKKYYEKHAGKFEIVGIACNDKEQNWQKAVADNALPWINVINPKESPAARDLVIQYGIQGFPSKIILDPDGRIASVVVGESPEFYTKLDSLLK